MTSDNCIFCKIIAGEIPSQRVWESETLVAFRDIAPLATTHVLVVPREHYRDVVALAADRPLVVSEIATAGQEIATLDGHTDFKLLFNSGALAGQTVFHVHAHVIAGERLGQSGSTEIVPEP